MCWLTNNSLSCLHVLGRPTVCDFRAECWRIVLTADLGKPLRLTSRPFDEEANDTIQVHWWRKEEGQ